MDHGFDGVDSYLSVTEASRVLGCSRQTIHNLIKGEHLDAKKELYPSGQWEYRIRRADVERRLGRDPGQDGAPRGEAVNEASTLRQPVDSYTDRQRLIAELSNSLTGQLQPLLKSYLDEIGQLKERAGECRGRAEAAEKAVQIASDKLDGERDRREAAEREVEELRRKVKPWWKKLLGL